MKKSTLVKDRAPVMTLRSETPSPPLSICTRMVTTQQPLKPRQCQDDVPRGSVTRVVGGSTVLLNLDCELVGAMASNALMEAPDDPYIRHRGMGGGGGRRINNGD